MMTWKISVRQRVLIPAWACLVSFFIFESAVILLSRVDWIYAGSVETYLSAVQYGLRRLRLGRDLPIAAAFGLVAATVIVARSRGHRVGAALQSLLGIVVGMGLCLGQLFYITLMFRGDLPTLGLRANGWAHGAIYATAAFALSLFAALVVERLAISTNAKN